MTPIKVCITSTARTKPWSPYARANFERVLRAARESERADLQVVNSPSAADIVMFVESNDDFQSDIRATRAYRNNWRRAIAIDSRDNPVPTVPGLYCGIPLHKQGTGIYRGGVYLRVADNPLLEQVSPEATYLFSFVGRVANCPRVRAPLMRLSHRRAFVADRRSGQSDGDAAYFEMLRRSKFVLCPRGIGPSTWRCYEAMRAGRVPVILSDTWLAPEGPDWPSFALRISEARASDIVPLLEAHEPSAEDMGAAARRAWDCHFSVRCVFGWLVDQAQKIVHRLARSGAARHVALRAPLVDVVRAGKIWRFAKASLRERIRRE